jgi:hypothetical protein
LLNSQSDGLTTRTAASLSLIENINPGLINHDGLLYAYNTKTPSQDDFIVLYGTMGDALFNRLLYYAATLYKILILSTLRNF